MSGIEMTRHLPHRRSAIPLVAYLARSARLASIAISIALAQGSLAAATSRDAEHRRIAQERAAANALFLERERACNRQFVVTACVERARDEQRETLDRLRREKLVLDEAQRHETAEAQRQAAAVKASAQAARAEAAASSSSTPSSRERGHRAPLPNPETSSKSADRLRKATATPTSEAERRAEEARHEAEFNAKAQAAEARREAVERRNAERSATGKAVAPLPVPNHAPADASSAPPGNMPINKPNTASAAGR